VCIIHGVQIPRPEGRDTEGVQHNMNILQMKIILLNITNLMTLKITATNFVSDFTRILRIWGFVKNNLPDLIGFYPILNDDALSGLWFRNRSKNCLLMRKTSKTLKGLYHLG
jgi:hypothetical protein